MTNLRFLLFLLCLVSLNLYADYRLLTPAGSKPIGNNRFQSSKKYQETVREMRQRLSAHYNMIQFGPEINLAHLRFISFYNPKPQALLDTVNIYTNLLTGITELFFAESIK
jgi:hypothetical protein